MNMKMNTEGYAMNGVRLSLREIRGTRNTSSYNLPFFGFFTHLRPLEDRTSSVLLSCSSVLFFLSAFVALPDAFFFDEPTLHVPGQFSSSRLSCNEKKEFVLLQNA